MWQTYLLVLIMTIMSIVINGAALCFIFVLLDEMEDHIQDENEDQNNYF